MSYAVTREAMAVRAALACIPAACKYHGDQIEGRDRWRFAGACCATGEPSLMRRRAEVALASLEKRATPASSDEPARCPHGKTEPHEAPGVGLEYRCPGPAASGTPDGGAS